MTVRITEYSWGRTPKTPARTLYRYSKQREFFALPIRDVNSLYPCSLLEEIAMIIVSCGCILSGIGIFVGVRPFLERIGLV
jgi:hypothetical protein